jgi:hypothetical protein
MKTTTSLTLALTAMLALGASALADQQPNQQSSKKAKMSGAKATAASTQSAKSKKTWDDQPMPLRAIGYPVVFMERAGHSIIRSPQIVSDTTKGKRDLVSKKGLMTEREMKQTKQTKKTTK